MLKEIKYFLYFFISLLAQSAVGQSEINIDNFKTKLESRDNRKDQHYFLDSIQKHSEENSTIYFFSALQKAQLLRKENQNVKALKEFKKITENENSGSNPEILAEAYLSISSIYAEQGSIDLAKNYLTEAFIIFSSTNNLELKALTLIKTADLEKRSENYSAAIRHLKQAHDIYLEAGKIYPSVELAQKIGALAYQSGEFMEAEQFLNVSLNGQKELGNIPEQTKILETLTSIYKFEGRLNEAIKSQQELIQISSTLKNKKQQAAFHEELSAIYGMNNRSRDALLEQEKAVNILSNESSIEHYHSLLKLSELYNTQNRETDAILTLHKANSLAQNLDDKNSIISSAKIISDFYKNRNQWKQAHTYLALSDSLKNSLLEKKIRKLEKKSLSATETSQVENNVAERKIPQTVFFQNWKIYFIALCTAIIIIISLLIFNYKKKKRSRQLLEWKVFKRTEELRSVNEELNTYIYKSSHDLRNPLTSIKSLITLLKGKQDSEQRLKYVNLIEDCAIQMDEILLNLSRAVDYKKVDVTVEQINFQHLKDELAQSLHPEQVKGLDLSWEIREKAPFYSDAKLIKVILKKTILNSLQYRLGSSSDYCKISIITDRSGASVLVEDNGQGIAAKVKDSVFDMFVKGTHKSKGAGLGLYLVKIASDKIKGRITLESEENKGAKLIFNLPNLV